MAANSTPFETTPAIAPRTLAACAGIAREHERERWLCALLAPPDGRTTLAVLYAFAAELSRTREAVSEPVMGRIRLEWWRETVDRAAAGRPQAQPVAEALAALMAAGRAKARDLTQLIDAREADLGDGFARTDDFLEYADATAGALNRLAIEALMAPGAPGDAAHQAGRHVGRALALLGHLRAAPANAAQGRVMLPEDVLARHGLDRAALLSGRPGPRFQDAAREWGARAEAELSAARALAPGVPRAALPVTALARICDAHLRHFRRKGWEVFGARPGASPAAAPLAVLRAGITGKY